MSELNVSSQIDTLLTDLANQDEIEAKDIRRVDQSHIKIKEEMYELVGEYREGFDLEAFKVIYHEYFEKFEFIVGDWASNKLRLKGFYQLNKRNVPRNQIIDFLDDYIKEYCNFGAAYFVLAKENEYSRYLEIKEQGITSSKSNAPSKRRRTSNKLQRRRRNHKTAANRKPKHNKKKTQIKEEFSMKQRRPAQVKKRANVNKRIVKETTERDVQINKKQFVIKQKTKTKRD